MQNTPTEQPPLSTTAPSQPPSNPPQTPPIQTQSPGPVQPVNNDVNDRLWGAVSYIPMLALLALIVRPNSAFIKLHGRQGLLMFFIFFASLFLYVMIEPLGALLAGLIQLGLFVLGVYSAFMAFMGNWWKIPMLGDIAEKIPVEVFTRAATEALSGQTPASQNNNEEPKPPVAGSGS